MRYDDWQIAIPSYRRSKALADKTMAYLKQCNIDMGRVTVFVADSEEKAIYGCAIRACRIVVACPGMRAVRNYIQNYYDEGARVFNIDDDVDAIYRKVSDNRAEIVTSLADEISSGFEICARWRLRLWGIGAVLNPLFMSHGVSTDLKYIVGCAWGVINSRDQRLAVTLDDKEDFERTIKFYLADGGVVRMNYLAPKTRYYKEPGGMQIARTPQRVAESASYLASRYPWLCRLNTRKKHAEVVLKDTRVKRVIRKNS